ncbi:interleukin-27 receptor subunit alpha isoform X1 [Sphaerodactylus townsendi]|uniref:interleukin-27 receptor subunit alpha isoform X1 n=2 Tax=Sphaerodactylus townsendi TaxID=933632 RepID=UPI002026730A|nr:interleukin-27 receptor subunit alpha isoform X1 [Sphaerodactylus townsendi]XP_048348226.1 interleukin-27 receptor subunit alpha isoform X1 [Sphaerodactylus townsendi]
MKSQWNTAWLLLLALKAFGLKEGHPRGSLGLQCHLLLPREDMNCSWSAQFANSPHILFFYQNLNIDPDEVHRVQVPLGQNWLVIARSQLMVGDRYRVWLEVHHADWMEESEKLTFRPYEKVKPLAPELDPVVVSSSGVTVKWKTPYWSEQLSHQPLVCELRYKTSKDAVWASLGVDHVSQEGHEFEDLDPFTRYSVQVRCIPEDGQGTWSEWSPPQTFRTPEAAPLGQVDVWRSRNLSENAEPRLYLLWKALDQKAARGDILNYTVDFWDHRKTLVASSISVCCSIPIPASASYVQVSAFNSAGKTLPASLNLGQTDLPGPQDVWVLAVPNLGFNVTWTLSPTPGGAQPEHYVVECREEISRELADWISKPVGCSSTLLKGDYRPTEPYLVSVYAIYVDGSNSSAPVRAYVKEGAPSVGPQAVKDESVSSTASLISWEEIPLANQNGHLTHVTIYLKHPTPAGPKIFGPIAAKERSYALEGLDPGTSYELWMTGSTSAGEGPASPVHKFHTPGARWQISLVVLLSVGFLLIVAIVVVIIRRRWFLGLCHKVLPLWCWESVPDPGRSTVFVRMEDQRAALAQDSSSQAPPEPPEEPDVLEITEPAPPQTANPPRVVFSGYEKHFMPSREELQELT